jgi:hypothetical protein
MMKKVKPFTSAYLEDDKGNRIVVRVPVDLSGVIPEEPKVILFERRVYIQTLTSPLTYVNVLGGRAKRL